MYKRQHRHFSKNDIFSCFECSRIRICNNLEHDFFCHHHTSISLRNIEVKWRNRFYRLCNISNSVDNKILNRNAKVSPWPETQFWYRSGSCINAVFDSSYCRQMFIVDFYLTPFGILNFLLIMRSKISCFHYDKLVQCVRSVTFDVW